MSTTPPTPPTPPMPPMPPTQSQPAGQVPQPASIRTAVRLMWAGAVVSLVGLVVTLATLGSLKQQIRDQLAQSDQKTTADMAGMVDAAYAVAIVGGVVFGIIGILLWLWMAWKNGQGRPWARVVATVLGGVNVLSTLYSVFAGSTVAAATVLSVVNLVLAVAILVLLWRRESSDFYAARSGRPQHG